MDFKKRTLNAIVSGSKVYKAVLLDYDYLLYSPKFNVDPYYIVSANKDNYKHLTGVSSQLPAKVFFDKCYNGSITESDFDFAKGQKNEKAVKGAVRQKILSMPSIACMFSSLLRAEEDFSKGKVYCLLSVANTNLTVGFAKAKNMVPKTLLHKNQLNFVKSVDVTLILRRNRGSINFDTILFGGEEDLLELLSLCLDITGKSSVRN